MTKKSDAPAIRFKGFSDAWEQRKFSDIATIELAEDQQGRPDNCEQRITKPAELGIIRK